MSRQKYLSFCAANVCQAFLVCRVRQDTRAVHLCSNNDVIKRGTDGGTLCHAYEFVWWQNQTEDVWTFYLQPLDSFIFLKPPSTSLSDASMSSLKCVSSCLLGKVAQSCTNKERGFYHYPVNPSATVRWLAALHLTHACVRVFSAHNTCNVRLRESVKHLEDVNDTHPLTLFKRLAIYCHRFHLEGLPSRRVAVWAFISILVTISLVTITMATVSEACSFCILKCWAAAEWKERWGKKT